MYVAEDDEFAAQAISMQLGALKVASEIFSDGLKLVNAYKARNGAGLKFILMDLGMPGMDGYAVTLVSEK